MDDGVEGVEGVEGVKGVEGEEDDEDGEGDESDEGDGEVRLSLPSSQWLSASGAEGDSDGW